MYKCIIVCINVSLYVLIHVLYIVIINNVLYYTYKCIYVFMYVLCILIINVLLYVVIGRSWLRFPHHAGLKHFQGFQVVSIYRGVILFISIYV